jgi:hypothetical protein
MTAFDAGHVIARLILLNSDIAFGAFFGTCGQPNLSRIVTLLTLQPLLDQITRGWRVSFLETTDEGVKQNKEREYGIRNDSVSRHIHDLSGYMFAARILTSSRSNVRIDTGWISFHHSDT